VAQVNSVTGENGGLMSFRVDRALEPTDVWSGSSWSRGTHAGMTRTRRRVAAPVITAAVALLAVACTDSSNATELNQPVGAPGQAASPGVAAAEADAPVEKVTVAGDSISVGLGASLREAVAEDVTVKVIGEVGTGLARPDGFDWPERLRELARDYPPDVLVFSLSSNDAQDLVDADGDVVASFSDEGKWDMEYAARLAEAFDAFENTGTTVVWVGHVRTERDKVGLTNRHIHELAQGIAATRPWVQVRDLAEILGSGEDVAEECLVADGLHLDADCLELAAKVLATSPPIA